MTIDSSSEAEVEDTGEGEDEMDVDVSLNHGAPQEETRAPIPLPLLARLLQEGFTDKTTKIEKGALELTSKYMETFVREALARAEFERTGKEGGGISDGFLQVEDLEKLAPQLILDF